MMEPPRSELSDWLSGYLFDRRIVVLRGPLDDATSTRVATELMTLDATADEPVTLQLDSPGGAVGPGLTLVDVLSVLGVTVKVLCMGRVEGSAVAVGASGHHRLALPHTRFRFADPTISFEARASQAEHVARAELSLLERYHESLARATGQALEDVTAWCATGRYVDAAEARRIGLIDDISGERTPLRRIH